MFKKSLSLFDKFISSHLNILIEKIASEHLLSVLCVEELRVHESVSEDGFCDE